MNFVQIADFDWLPWLQKCKIFDKKYEKIFFSEAIRGMKLKLGINVCVIILYIVFFIAVAHVVLLIWQL